jgi:hypothetical protein
MSRIELERRVDILDFHRRKMTLERQLLDCEKSPMTELYPYVYVNTDGSARELHPDERNYLETPFAFGDGGRPYIKRIYSQKDGWGEITGYLERKELPQGTPVYPAPIENPNKPIVSREDRIQFFRKMGFEVEVDENGGDTFTVRKKPKT